MLSWLLQEPASPQVQDRLAAARFVVTSELTLLECQRAVVRLHVLGQRSAAEEQRLRRRLSSASGHWVLLTVSREILARAAEPLAAEPLRSLDAVHLASALATRAAVPGPVELLSLDDRLRRAALELGFGLVS